MRLSPLLAGFGIQNRGNCFNLRKGHLSVIAGGYPKMSICSCTRPRSLYDVIFKKRPYHTILPGMLTKDGKFSCLYTVMGGYNQLQSHTQFLVNMLSFG